MSSAPDRVAAPTAPARLGVATTRGRGASRGVIVALQVLTFVVLIGAWEAMSRTGIADPFFFSKPSDIAQRVLDLIVSGEIWEHLAVTLVEAMLAFLIGT